MTSDCVPVHTTFVRPDGALHGWKIEISEEVVCGERSELGGGQRASR